MKNSFTVIVLSLFIAESGTAASPDVALSPIASADFDASVGFRVNGKPFFPIVLYDAPTDDATLADLHDFRFNVVTCRPDVAAVLPKHGFYAAVHSGKNKVDDLSAILFAMGTDSPALYFKQDLLKQTAEANAKTAAAVPNRPLINAIGYWEDEPVGVKAGKLPSRAKYEDLVAAIDVSAPYLYPVPYQSVSTVGDAVARARQATNGNKPLLPILQLFSWEPGTRYPTPAELNCMTMLALVEGAHGIGYYSYGHVTGKPKTTIAEADPELWRSVQALNATVARIGPRLISERKSEEIAPTPTSTKAVKFKAVRGEKETLVVLVNSADTAQTAELQICRVVIHAQPTDDVEELKRECGGVIQAKDHKVSMLLRPFETAVLHWADPK